MRHVLDAAALQDISPSEKLALMALADDASEHTNKSWPGLEKVQRWACVGKRRALELIANLIEKGYVESVSAGFPGQRAVYLVKVPPAHTKPVDNSQIMGAESRTPKIMGAENPEKVRDLAPLSVNPLQLTKSPSDVTTEPVDNFTADDLIEFNSPAGIRNRYLTHRARRSLDIDELEQRAGKYFADFEQPRAVLLLLAYRILGKAVDAGRQVHSPTAYVAASIENEPEVHRKVAFTLNTGGQ